VSIRLRLTLTYTAILALTLAGMGGVLYGTQWRSLRLAETRVLSAVAERFAERLESGEPVPAEFRPQAPPGPDRHGRERRFGLPAAYWQAYSATGDPVLSSPELEDVILPVSDRTIESVLDGASWSGALRLDADRFVAVAVPISVDGTIEQVLVVAHSVTAQYDYLATLRRSILLGSGLAVAAAFACGWLLSGLVLRPVEQITRTANEIGADRDFGRRVAYRGPEDEIGVLARTFNTMLSELEAAYRQQQQFVADVSHELRTPLTTLRGNLELLRRDPPVSDEDRAEVLADMASESERLIRLVSDLLRLARADARQSLRTEIVPVAPLLDDLCRQARLLDPDRSISCACQSDADVLADRDGLKQVLLILVDNALKHTSGTVEVTARVGDDTLTIDVRDSGPGIPPDELPHVFDRFYRGDYDAEGQPPGLGLGLPIAKALIEAQGGGIDLASDVVDGSRFSVSLPLAP
jgi:signal transduction histidine kinase